MSYPIPTEELLAKYSDLLNNKPLNAIANWNMPNDDDELDLGQYVADATDPASIKAFAKIAIPAITKMSLSIPRKP
jgi:hypothetical protein